MKRVFAAILFTTWALSASAQTVSYEAVRVADLIITDSAWKPVGEMFSLVIDQASRDPKLKAKNNADIVLVEELRRSLNRENFAKAMAQALTDNFSVDELKEIERFLRSPVGQKWASLSEKLTSDPKFFQPMIDQACDAAAKRLSGKKFSAAECKAENGNP